jgi:hypothetical protein
MTQVRKELRKEPRTKTFWSATLRTLRKVYDCRIVDVSPGGAQVRLVTPEIGAPATLNEIVMLTVDGVGRLVGVVAWMKKNSVGIKFDNPRIVEEWSAAIAKIPLDADGRKLRMKRPTEPGTT